MVGAAENPLQSAHIIEFDVGVIDLALTPEYLDSDANIKTAHRKTCNQAVELDLAGSMKRLKGLGVRELPAFLPDTVFTSVNQTGERNSILRRPSLTWPEEKEAIVATKTSRIRRGP